MKRTNTRPLVRQPRALPREPASPFRSHLPLPAQRRQLKDVERGRRVLAQFAMLLAAGCTIAYFAYHANRATSASLAAASKSAQTFVADLSNHDYWAAETQLSPTAQRLHSPQALKQEFGLLESKYGDLVSAQAASTAPRSVGGLQTCRVEYWLTLHHGAVPLHIILVRGYRRWSIESYSIG